MLDDNATSRDARNGGARRSALLDDEAERGETALSVLETDPERIAFNLWNEGRVDEAIQFLEREIATRRETHGPENHADSSPNTLTRIGPNGLQPVSDWRERHRSALSPAEFNAFGASVNTIDLVARPADAIVPHPPRSSRRAWVMVLGLVVIGFSASALFLNGRAGAPGDTVAPAVEPSAVVEPASIVPAEDAKPEVELASAQADADPTPAAVIPDVAPVEASAEIADAPPPDDALPPEDVGLDPAPTTAPETTASIEPAPVAEEPAIVEARLPRQRPEPPADLPRTVAAADPSPPVVFAPSPPPGYAPGPAPLFDPMNPRPTLTPAEYQVLLERRAWAQNYVSRRRALAEQRAMMEEPRGFLGDPGPVVRILRN